MSFMTLELMKDEAALIKWVAQAAAKDDARPTLEYLSVEADYLVATNGYVLSAAPLPESLTEHIGKLIKPVNAVKAGLNLFEVDDSGLRYPDWHSVFDAQSVSAYHNLDVRQLRNILPATSLENIVQVNFHPGFVTLQHEQGFALLMPYSGPRRQLPDLPNVFWAADGIAIGREKYEVLRETGASITLAVGKVTVELRGKDYGRWLNWKSRVDKVE